MSSFSFNANVLLLKLYIFRAKWWSPFNVHAFTNCIYQPHLFNQSRMKYKTHPIIMMVAFFERSIARLAIYCWMYCLSVYDSCVCVFSSLIFSPNRTLVSHVISLCSTIFRVVFLIAIFFFAKIFYLFILMLVIFFSLSWRRLFSQNSYFINRMKYSCIYCTTHWCFLFVHFVHSRVFLARWISIWWNYLAFFAQPPNVQRVMITKVCAISIFRCKNRNVACDVHARHNFSSSK